MADAARKVVSFICSPESAEMLRRAAELAGYLSVAEWCRVTLLAEARRILDPQPAESRS